MFCCRRPTAEPPKKDNEEDVFFTATEPVGNASSNSDDDELGVGVDGLKDLRDQIKAHNEKHPGNPIINVHDAVREVMKKATRHLPVGKQAFLNTLPEHQVGKINVFGSHAWVDNVTDLLETLIGFCDQRAKQGDICYFYLDIICNDQYAIAQVSISFLAYLPSFFKWMCVLSEDIVPYLTFFLLVFLFVCVCVYAEFRRFKAELGVVDDHVRKGYQSIRSRGDCNDPIR